MVHLHICTFLQFILIKLPPTLTPQQALPKLQRYCAYQERCHLEVKEKLAEYGIYGKDAEQIISTLIENNYLNEERFAIQFAGGHFRSKEWGRRKIQYALKQKGVSNYCIRKAIQQIAEDDYEKILLKLAAKKWASLNREKNIFIKKRKLQDFLLQRGFEAELIAAWIKKV